MRGIVDISLDEKEFIHAFKTWKREDELNCGYVYNIPNKLINRTQAGILKVNKGRKRGDCSQDTHIRPGEGRISTYKHP